MNGASTAVEGRVEYYDSLAPTGRGILQAPYRSSWRTELQGTEEGIAERYYVAYDGPHFGLFLATVGEELHTLPLERPISRRIDISESTAIDQQRPGRDVTTILLELSAKAKEEDFEDGMLSNFARGLISLTLRFGDITVKSLETAIMRGTLNEEVTSEALRWLGDMDHQATHQARLRLLQACLWSSSARIRDAAGSGLSFLDDASAVPSLAKAIERETCEELRNDLRQVLEQLKNANRP